MPVLNSVQVVIWKRNPLGFFLDKTFEVGHFEPASYNQWSTLVNASRFNIHNSFCTIKGDTTSLLR